MDTSKDQQELERLFLEGRAEWIPEDHPMPRRAARRTYATLVRGIRSKEISF
jgi:hypothetical protein